LLSRSEAVDAIRAGLVRVDRRTVRDPGALVVPEGAAIEIDGAPRTARPWRTILLNKPRGVVTTRRDPGGRRTVYDVLGERGRGLVAVGRLDLATTGLLLFTSDTQLANWIADPVHAIARVYVVRVRGRVDGASLQRLTEGMELDGEMLRAHAVQLRKASVRESHLVVELVEGKNREIRRLFQAIGHDVTHLKRVRLGGLELGDLAPGETRTIAQSEIATAFPGAPIRDRLL
jgi:23S rRNA pseudouridine2605 synthase